MGMVMDPVRLKTSIYEDLPQLQFMADLWLMLGQYLDSTRATSPQAGRIRRRRKVVLKPLRIEMDKHGHQEGAKRPLENPETSTAKRRSSKEMSIE